MLFKTIIFSDAPVLKGFKYKNKFQLVPILYTETTPMSRYAKHFPAFLEYEVDVVEEESSFEDELKKIGFSKELINFGSYLSNQERIKKEILQLLTCLTNYHFFSYDSSFAMWGIQIPSDSLEEIESKDLAQLDEAKSKWTFGCYRYPGMKENLIINSYTHVLDYYAPSNTTDYYTNNPGVWLTPELSFPQNIEFCLDRYYTSDKELYKRTKHCLGLLTDGIELFNTKRSTSLLSIVSSIEGMALMDYKMYGETKGLGAKSRFIRYLRRYVAGKSTEKYEGYYAKRCNITHEGELFVGDLDIFSETDVQHKDWLFRLEIMQVARFALYNWLSRKL